MQTAAPSAEAKVGLAIGCSPVACYNDVALTIQGVLILGVQVRRARLREVVRVRRSNLRKACVHPLVIQDQSAETSRGR
eukprot:3723564-Pyramimonas_sp.AAC.1